MRDRDPWVDDMLGLDDAPPDGPLPRGSVPYLPCGVEEILAMVREAPLRADDRFVDLGSGLGRVVMLAHLLTGARASGIEIQGPLVARARAASEALGLDVDFEEGNAEDAALAGSVFFLYAPFNGPVLARVLARLEALPRPITIGAVGVELHQGWLRPRATTCVSLVMYESI